MSGFRRIEHDHGFGYIFDEEHQTPEEKIDDLWDENIDYVMALREVLRELDGSEDGMIAYQIAEEVLEKHKQLETQDNEEDTNDTIDDDITGLQYGPQQA